MRTIPLMPQSRLFRQVLRVEGDAERQAGRDIDSSTKFGLSGRETVEKIDIMKFNKNIGMILLAVYLIFDGLLGFGLNVGPAIFLLYLVAMAAGVFILIGK
jgi:hypothetical protein